VVKDGEGLVVEQNQTPGPTSRWPEPTFLMLRFWKQICRLLLLMLTFFNLEHSEAQKYAEVCFSWTPICT